MVQSVRLAPSWVALLRWPPMVKLLHAFVYALLWSTITVKNVVAQIFFIFRSELLGLLGKAPTISTIASAVHPLKKWKHIGLILDYTHFGSNGMLVGSSIAKLVAVVLAADSSHTSVFLPRRTSIFPPSKPLSQLWNHIISISYSPQVSNEAHKRRFILCC